MQHIFTASEYYKILDLPSDSSVEDIKKAYRKKARLFHPDINHAPDAKDLFITATEAYEFLLAYHEKIKYDEQAYHSGNGGMEKVPPAQVTQTCHCICTNIIQDL